jgi:nitrite reductase (NADH) large subunit
MAQSLVVVGAGMAATRFVRHLSDAAPGRYDVTVIGAEAHEPYNRVLLSSLLAEEVGIGEIALESGAWWRRCGVNLIRGREAVSLDVKTRRLALDDGASLGFDRLVLATGSDPVRLPLPGADLAGVLTFRTIADVEHMQAAARTGTRAVVIGGGLLGLEAAHGLARAGAIVTVVHVMDRLMERQLDPAAALMLKDTLERRGIAVRLGANTTRILGDTRVAAVEFADGETIDADMVVMSVGIRPNTALARQAGLAVARGVVVDDGLATSDAAVFAIGECAEHRGIAYGLVEPAYEQARVLARRLAGHDDLYEGSVTATNLKVSGVKLFSAGEFLGGDGMQALVLRDRGLHIYKKLVLRETARGAVLAGCVLYGDTDDGLWYLDLMRRGTPVDAMRGDLIFGRMLIERKAA